MISLLYIYSQRQGGKAEFLIANQRNQWQSIGNQSNQWLSIGNQQAIRAIRAIFDKHFGLY
jgi:hypothetical protein